jgi:hypothetical protein
MQLGSLIKAMHFNRPLMRQDGGAYPLETGKGIFRTYKDLYGEESYQYYTLIIHLFDRAIVTDNLHALSTEQQKLLKQYFEEAKPLTDMWEATPDEDIEDFEYDFKALTKHILVLDEFLGSYFGEEHGKYSRYEPKRDRFNKKQLYRQRQYPSKTFENIDRA